MEQQGRFGFQDFRAEAKELFNIGLPIIIGQLGIMAMGVADTIQVGMIAEKGAAAVSASGLSNTFYFLIAIFGLVGLGVIAPMIAKADAEEKTEEVKQLFWAGIRVAIYLGAVIWLIIFSMGVVFDMLKQDAEVVALAKPYNTAVSFSIFPLFLFMALRQLSDGLGFTQLAMKVTVSAFFLNVLLNWLFINGIWFFPRLELLGAGIATLLSRIYMFFALLFLMQKQDVFKEKMQKTTENIQELVKKVLKIGLPAGFQGFFEIGVFSAAVVIIGWYGKQQQAAHFIAINMCSVTYMMVTGIASAGGIRVGHFWGLQDRAKMIGTGSTALWLAGGFMAICATVFIFAPTFMVNFYTTDTNVVSIAVSLLIIGGFFQLSDGLQATSLGILRGVSDVNIPTVITLFAYWVVGLPLGYYLGEYWDLKAVGVWLGLTAGLTASALLLSWRFFWVTKRMNFQNISSD